MMRKKLKRSVTTEMSTTFPFVPNAPKDRKSVADISSALMLL